MRKLKILLALAVASVAVLVVGQRHNAGQKEARAEACDGMESENEALFI